MTSFLLPVVTGESSSAERLRVAVAAYLARYRGLSREHTASDLRVVVADVDACATPCSLPGLVRRTGPGPGAPGAVRALVPGSASLPSRPRCPSGARWCTGSTAPASSTGCWSTPRAQWLRRPTVPAESPTLGLTHLQFEALLSAARESANINDFALVATLGLLGLRIFESCAADITDVGEEHGHRVLRVVGKGAKVVLVPLPPAVGRAIDRAVDGRTEGPLLRNRRGGRMDRHAATRRLRHLADDAGCGYRGCIRTCSGTPS